MVLMTTIHLMLSNAFCSTTGNLKITLTDVTIVKTCSKCDHMAHIPLHYFTKPMNACTFSLVFGGIIFTMDSNFYLFFGFHSESPRNLDITSCFVRRMDFQYFT